MAALWDKKCAACGGRIAFRHFMGTRTRTLVCRQCGARLEGNLGRQLIGIATGSLFISVPMSQGMHDPRWWWALIPGAALYFIWSYLFISLRAVGGPMPSSEVREP